MDVRKITQGWEKAKSRMASTIVCSPEELTP